MSNLKDRLTNEELELLEQNDFKKSKKKRLIYIILKYQ